MKKVWILEGFISKEEMEKELNTLLQEKMNATTYAEKVAVKEIVEIYHRSLKKNPDGRWIAYQGKTNYKQFCQCAQETLRNMKKHNMKWRVIEGSIQDEAKTWVGYETVKENIGVMKYLWATL